MSAYQFIASDKELEEVKNEIKFLSVNEALVLGFEIDFIMDYILKNGNPDEKIIAYAPSEEAFNDLEILREDISYYADDYTKKKYSASVSMRMDEKNGLKLLEYINTELKKVDEIELWGIWKDELEPARFYEYTINEFTLEELNKVFGNWDFKPQCITIKKE